MAAKFHLKPVKLSITSLYLTVDPINVLLAYMKVTPFFPFLTSKNYTTSNWHQTRFVNSYDVSTSSLVLINTTNMITLRVILTG